MSKHGHTIYLVVIGVLIVSIVMLVFDEQQKADQTSDTHSTSIAVLPFISIGREEQAMRFSDEVTNDIVIALAQVPQLKVASRSSVEAFADSKRDVSAIGNALAVSRILEGAVRIDQSHIRVTAQLIDVATGAHLWSETYDREASDLDVIAADIAEQVVNAGYDGR